MQGPPPCPLLTTDGHNGYTETIRLTHDKLREPRISFYSIHAHRLSQNRCRRLKTGEHLSLVFLTVLDYIRLGFVDEDEELQAIMRNARPAPHTEPER